MVLISKVLAWVNLVKKHHDKAKSVHYNYVHKIHSNLPVVFGADFYQHFKYTYALSIIQ